MTFSDPQVRRLKAKLDVKRVKSRQMDGRDVSYVEGWYVMAEANRIFGFDGWDRLSHSHQLLYDRREAEVTYVAYFVRVRVSVRAGSSTVVREGSGFGSAVKADAGEAHEFAFKAAETDGTKRALATFGNRFGLALYDKEHSGVTKPRSPAQGVSAHTATPSAPITNDSKSDHTSDQSHEADAIQNALIFLKATKERLGRAISAAEVDDILARVSSELNTCATLGLIYEIVAVSTLQTLWFRLRIFAGRSLSVVRATRRFLSARVHCVCRSISRVSLWRRQSDIATKIT